MPTRKLINKCLLNKKQFLELKLKRRFKMNPRLKPKHKLLLIKRQRNRLMPRLLRRLQRRRRRKKSS